MDFMYISGKYKAKLVVKFLKGKKITKLEANTELEANRRKSLILLTRTVVNKIVETLLPTK